MAEPQELTNFVERVERVCVNSAEEKNGTKKIPARPAAYCNPSRAVRVGIAPRKVSESGTFQTFVRETSKLELEKPRNAKKSGAEKTPISKILERSNFRGERSNNSASL